MELPGRKNETGKTGIPGKGIHSMTPRSLTSRICALLLSLCCLALPALPALAAGEKTLPAYAVPDRSLSSHKALTVRLGRARLAMTGRLIDGTAYLPVSELCDLYADCRVTNSPDGWTLEAPGLSVSGWSGATYLTVNGRVFYDPHPIVILSDGDLYVPLETAKRLSGMQATLSQATATVTLTGPFTPPTPGDAVYDPDALYWLSRIISAESRGEPLAGQIAVGNVILNRVRSTAFPNTIWGVIFDRKDGVQFTPVANGTVYAAPYWISTVAAKICLEGYSLSTSALFFYEPSKATSYWIENNRPYLFTVGHHRFFS